MTKRELVAPPVGTIYQVRRHGWRAGLLDNEYWQVERRTEKTVWLRRLVTDSEGKPIPGMAHSGFPLRQCRVLQDARLRIRKDAYKDVYVDLYRDIYTPAS
jgi:hypothetical protein